MENGDERVGGMELRDKKNVENVVLEDKTEGGLEMGSGESVDSEGEVFEEASDSQDQLREKGEKSESGAVDSTIGDCGSMTVAKNSNAETFEEAIGAPVAVGTPDELVAVVSEEKVEDLVGVESNDKIDKGATSGEVGGNEPNGAKEVFRKEEILVSEVGNGESHNWEDASGQILPEDGKIEELKDNLDAEYQETSELADVSLELQEVKDGGPGEILATVDIEHWDDKSGELTVDTAVVDSGNRPHIDESLRDNQAGKNMEVKGDADGDVKNSYVAADSEHNQESYESKPTSAVLHESVEQPAVIPETLSPPRSEKFVNEKKEEVQPYAANLGAEDSKRSESLQAEKRAIDVDKNSSKAKQLENRVENVSRDHKINLAPNLGSSTGRPTRMASSTARPAGLGRAAPLLEPAPRAAQPPRVNGTVSHVQSQQVEDPTNGEADEYDETREKLQMIRVKFLRLAHRLGQTPHNVVVAQVLYRLGLAEQLRGRNGGRVGAFSFDRASAMAEQLEAAGQEPLDFSCTIMVLGKTGVGKSATINSIFDELKFGTDAFQLSTKKVQDVVGTVQGIKVRVIDTPGLLPSCSDQRQNEKILHSIKRFIKRTPPDIVLYLDRLDMQSRDFGDMPLLRTITEIFGPSIWFKAIIVLTHGASAPPDGPNGTASSYDMFFTQRSHVVQQEIRQAAGDMRLMNPVSLVENHSACRKNRAGQRVLPNGQVWKPHLLLLSFAAKILAEANSLLKLQDGPSGKLFATHSRSLPLPFLLSSLLQSRPQVKLPEEQFGDEDDIDDDLDEILDGEDESEYDDLPPFKSLTKAQLAKLTKSQKKAYFDELELREKLFMQKQLKEEKRRRKMMKKMAAAAKDLPSDYIENIEEESGGAASVPVPMPDLALPASFDSDYPTHRYRFLDSSNQWVVRPVLETHGWDHDVGYEGINVERLFAVKEKIPLSFSGQVTKDKKDANVQMELASSIKHGEGKATSVGFDMQSVGKDLVYTLRSDTRFSNFRKNKASAGLSITLMGDALSAGMKVEDKVILNKRFQMVISGGAMTGRGDVAYGGSLEAQLRDKDYPLGRSLSTLGLSVMDWHGDLAVGCNIQSQIPVGRTTNLMARANLNNRGSGQISIRVNSSEQLQLALVAFVPLLKKLLSYPQQMQFGQ
uniref:Protein translocase n=1 Tax=Rhizophora mucronata TaxID=61149 RepID=A0A2P2LUB9_RHIMU